MLPAQYSGLHCDLCLSDNLLAVLNDKTLGVVADTLSCNIVCWRVDILVYLYGVDRCRATLKFETIEANLIPQHYYWQKTAMLCVGGCKALRLRRAKLA